MTLAIPIRERSDPSQAKWFGFCTCTPSFRREEATPLLSADTKLPRICTFSSYFKSRIFNARAARPASFRLTPFACADARYRGEGPARRSLGEGGRYSFLKSKCVAPIPRTPVSLRALPFFPLPTVHESPFTNHRSPNSFGLHIYKSRFRNSFRLHTCVQWGRGGTPPLHRCLPASVLPHALPFCLQPGETFSAPVSSKGLCRVWDWTYTSLEPLTTGGPPS